MSSAWESLDNEDFKLNSGVTPAEYNRVDEATRNIYLRIFNAGSNKRRRMGEPHFIPFEGHTKKRLELGELCGKFGGLLDRESSKADFRKGLVKIAQRVGKKSLDKKEVPFLGLAAPSGSGKTEFLKWIFNNCCTYVSSDEMSSYATSLVEEINQAMPENQEKLQEMLVLFASFSQTSNYEEGEGPIAKTTVERLLRSFHGNITMQADNTYNTIRYDGFDCLHHIMKHFSSRKDKGKTGFIFCIDEFSKLKKVSNIDDQGGRHGFDYSVYQTLMDTLLQESQAWLSEGGFCVIVGAGISMYDFGEVVLQLSARAYEPIQFPTKRPQMAKKAISYVQEITDVLQGSEASKEEEFFYLNVTTSMLESNAVLDHWRIIMNLKSTDTRVRPSPRSYTLPAAFKYDEIFVLVARALFREKQWRHLERQKVEALLNKLGGSVILKPVEGEFATNVLDLEWGQMVLPAWRLLELSANDKKNTQLFKWVQNWVLIEIGKLLYTYGPAEAERMWELATMGVLELRRALLFSIEEDENGEYAMLPTLQQIVDGLDVHHNVNEILMEAVAHPESVSNKNSPLQKVESGESKPVIWYSSVPNEKGIEGIFRGGFDSAEHEEVCLLFQMKLYEAASAMQVLNWLKKANERAKDLGLEEGSYVVQLFVTETIDDNICDRKDDWPANCMVFGTKALEALFEPFGEGFINEIIRLKRRKKPTPEVEN